MTLLTLLTQKVAYIRTGYLSVPASVRLAEGQSRVLGGGSEGQSGGLGGVRGDQTAFIWLEHQKKKDIRQLSYGWNTKKKNEIRQLSYAWNTKTPKP